MNRAAFMERVQPLIERFAGELADLLVEQVRAAFDAALSNDSIRAQPATPPGSPAKTRRAPAASRSAGTVVRGVGDATSHSAVPEPAVTAKQGSTSSKRKPNRCSECGAVGFNSQSCGKTHNVPTSPAAPDGPVVAKASTPATSTIKAPPLSAPRIDALPSSPRPRDATLPSANAKTELPASFDPDEDRREEFRDLSFLTTRRKC